MYVQYFYKPNTTHNRVDVHQTAPLTWTLFVFCCTLIRGVKVVRKGHPHRLSI